MSKFCGNCGAELDESARVCGQCGMPLNGEAVRMPNAPKVVDPEKQKKTRRKIKLVLGLLAVIVVAIIAINVISSHTGYRGTLRKVMNAYEDYDIDTLVSLSSDVYYYGYEDYVEYYFEYQVGEDHDSFEASVGHSYKISYEVEEYYTLSERKEEKLLDGLESAYPDFDIDTIEKIIVADVEVTAKQGKRSTEREVTITLTKEADGWKLLYIE